MAGKFKINENEGAIFRGFARAWPSEIWNVDEQEWQPYEGEVPKDYFWGTEVTAEEAAVFMRRD